jgi:hypothetical protein
MPFPDEPVSDVLERLRTANIRTAITPNENEARNCLNIRGIMNVRIHGLAAAVGNWLNGVMLTILPE